jgi:hypothetical protein
MVQFLRSMGLGRLNARIQAWSATKPRVFQIVYATWHARLAGN